MPNDAERLASRVAETRVCSVEMPAGTGKTETIAALVELLTGDGKRVLVLTHTNAGVAALRRRLLSKGLSFKAVHVSTICSWAEAAALAYPANSGFDPIRSAAEDTTAYYDACVAAATALMGLDFFASVVHTSYDALLVDEYQDCDLAQHGLVELLKETVPLVYVFGDRLQRIFDFKNLAFPSWEEVEASFASLDPGEVKPQRWIDSNNVLGDWLLGHVRPRLLAKQGIDFRSAPFGALYIVSGSDERDPYSATVREAYRMKSRAGSKLILCDPKNRAERIAIGRRLSGRYEVMENQEGTFVAKQLENFLQIQESGGCACWLANLAKQCFSGWGKCLDKTVMRALGSCRDLARYEKSRRGYENVLRSLQDYSRRPSADTFRAACRTIERCPATNLYAKDMWRDGTCAVMSHYESGIDPIETLAGIRESKKRALRGRGSVLASTLLVKGLEFNHVLIHNFSSLENERHIYVALTRASDSLTVVL